MNEEQRLPRLTHLQLNTEDKEYFLIDVLRDRCLDKHTYRERTFCQRNLGHKDNHASCSLDGIPCVWQQEKEVS